MPGYANRIITRDYPELSEEGDPVWVKIRNPKRVSYERLTPDLSSLGVTPADDKEAVAKKAAADPEAAKRETYEVIARLIIDWHVYDADDDAEDQALLGLPATGELVAKLPSEIQDDIAGLIEEAIAGPSR